MTSFVDSHAHLADPAFSDDVDEVIARARVSGARAIVCIGETIGAADRAAEIAHRYPGFLWHTAGVHPHEAGDFDAGRDVAAIRERIGGGAVAVGECGLDFHYNNASRDAQLAAFSSQLALAAEVRKPVIVHTREAADETAALIREYAPRGARGVLHCFTGPMALAEVALAADWYISFSGLVTFKSWTGDDLVHCVPTDRLLVESDAPYLAPVPNRGRRNEPSWVSLTAARVAQVRGVTAEELGRASVDNAIRLFGLATSLSPS